MPYSSAKDVNRFRPFYLYIFSPDKTALNQLSEKLRQRLSGIVKDGNLVREYSLTSDYAGGVAAVEIQNTAKDLLEIRQDKEGGVPRLTIKADVDMEGAGAKELLLRVKIPWSENTRFGGTSDELLSLVKWNLEPLGTDKEGVRYPDLKLVKQEVKDGYADLTFAAGWMKKSGDLGWRMYRLTGLLDTEKTAPPWVRAWSTDVDTTAEYGNRTLNLESSLGTLWNNKALKNHTVGSACVRVGAK